jgi:hypothetical protein
VLGQGTPACCHAIAPGDVRGDGTGGPRILNCIVEGDYTGRKARHRAPLVADEDTTAHEARRLGGGLMPRTVKKMGRPFGPHPLDPCGRSVKIPARNGDEWVWFRVDADQYRRVMAHRWRLDTGGYPVTTVFDTDTKTATHLSAHRMVTNAPAGVLVDHRYGNLLDARRCSLRFCTHQQNSANRRKDRRRKCSSRFRGVTLHRQTGRWQAQLKVSDRNQYLGLHDTEEAAALAYNRKASALHGRFARLNRVRKAKARAA